MRIRESDDELRTSRSLSPRNFLRLRLALMKLLSISFLAVILFALSNSQAQSIRRAEQLTRPRTVAGSRAGNTPRTPYQTPTSQGQTPTRPGDSGSKPVNQQPQTPTAPQR